MIKRIYPIYIVQDAQTGVPARPQRLKKVEVKVEPD